MFVPNTDDAIVLDELKFAHVTAYQNTFDFGLKLTNQKWDSFLRGGQTCMVSNLVKVYCLDCYNAVGLFTEKVAIL